MKPGIWIGLLPLAVALLGIGMSNGSKEISYRTDISNQEARSGADIVASKAEIARAQAEIEQLKAERERVQLELDKQKLAAQQTDNTLKSKATVATSPAAPTSVSGEAGAKLD